MTNLIIVVLLVLIAIVIFTPSLRTRISQMFKAKSNQLLDQIEDKVELLKQSIRDLKLSYDKSISGLAKVKAVEINYRSKAADFQNKATEYHNKALKLKEKLENKELDETTLKNDITFLLNKEDVMLNEAKTALANADQQKAIVDSLEIKIKNMKKLIDDTNVKIVNLEAQRDAAKINKDISKEMSNLNFDGISAHVEELQKSIDADNNEAKAWDNISTDMESDEERINKVLSDTKTISNSRLDDFLNNK